MQIPCQQAMIAPLEIPVTYMKNPRIMKIFQDNYGHMNEKYKPSFVQQELSSLQTAWVPSISNVHYMFDGNKFVPLPTKFPSDDKLNIKQTTDVQNQQPVLVSSSHKSFGTIPVKKSTNDSKEQFKFKNSKNFLKDSQPNNPVNEEISIIKEDTSKSSKLDNKIEILQSKSLFCTGCIERILRWNRSLKDRFCLYETIAPVVSLQEGSVAQQKIMLLRDKKGPILQVQYFRNTHIDIDDFHIGMYLRCVGRMIGYNILLADSIRTARDDEMSTLSRLSYVCDYSVTHNIYND